MGVRLLDATVRDLVTQELLMVSPGDAVAEVARRIAKNGGDAAVVVADGQPIGIVTEHDLVHRVLAVGLPAERAPVGDVMTSPVRTLPADAHASDAARLMTLHHVRHVPILEAGRLAGLVTDKDLLALSPILFEAARENGEPGRGPPPGHLQGVCEGCSTLSPDLREMAGALLCEDCADAGEVEETNR